MTIRSRRVVDAPLYRGARYLPWALSLVFVGCQILGGFDAYGPDPAAASSSGSGGDDGQGGDEPDGIPCGSGECDHDEVCLGNMLCLACGELPMLNPCGGGGGAGTCGNVAGTECSGDTCSLDCGAGGCAGDIALTQQMQTHNQLLSCSSGNCTDVTLVCDGPGQCSVTCADAGACIGFTLDCFNDGPCLLDCSVPGSCDGTTTIICQSNACEVRHEPPPGAGDPMPMFPGVQGCADSCDPDLCAPPAGPG